MTFLSVDTAGCLTAEICAALGSDHLTSSVLFVYLAPGEGYVTTSAAEIVMKIASDKLLNLYKVKEFLFMTNGPFPVIRLNSIEEWELITAYSSKRPPFDYPVIYTDGFTNVYTKDNHVLDVEGHQLIPVRETNRFMYRDWRMWFNKNDRLVIARFGSQKETASSNAMASLRLLTAECEAPVEHGWFGYRLDGVEGVPSADSAMQMVEILAEVTLIDGCPSTLRFPEFLEAVDLCSSFRVLVQDANQHFLNVPMSRRVCKHRAAILECVGGRPRKVLRYKGDAEGFCLSRHAHIAQVSNEAVYLLQDRIEVRWTNLFRD